MKHTQWVFQMYLLSGIKIRLGLHEIHLELYKLLVNLIIIVLVGWKYNLLINIGFGNRLLMGLHRFTNNTFGNWLCHMIHLNYIGSTSNTSSMSSEVCHTNLYYMYLYYMYLVIVYWVYMGLPYLFLRYTAFELIHQSMAFSKVLMFLILRQMFLIPVIPSGKSP